MDEHVLKRHNKTLLLYHLVYPVIYRRKIIDSLISESIKKICLEIADRFEIEFAEIGTDEDHIHFFVQSVPTMSVDQMIRTIKIITAREIFHKFPEVKKELWGGNFWTSGYYADTFGHYGNAEIKKKYVENQGRQYKQLYVHQLKLW